MDQEQHVRAPANPCVLVIFGIAGDLTKRLLFPAICNLGAAGLLNENFRIVGVAIEPYNNDSFREKLIKDVQEFVTDPDAGAFGLSFAKSINYISGDFSDPEVYSILKKQLDELGEGGASKNCLFYFAAPPEFMETIALQLSKASLLSEDDGHFRRIVVEKPFGHDLASAKN